MERLIEGFRRFRADDFEANRARFERLVGRPGHPRYAIVTCYDSRIDTSRVFDAVPGEVSREERQRYCELEALKSSLDNLLTFPWLKARIEAGSLQVDALHLDPERTGRRGIQP